MSGYTRTLQVKSIWFVRLIQTGLLVLFSFSAVAFAAPQSIKIVTSDFPPLTMLRDGHPSGIVVEVIEEVCRREGLSPEFIFLPWQRAQKQVLESKNILITPFTRTPDREAHYFWIAPILEFQTVLVTVDNPPKNIF